VKCAFRLPCPGTVHLAAEREPPLRGVLELREPIEQILASVADEVLVDEPAFDEARRAPTERRVVTLPCRE